MEEKMGKICIICSIFTLLIAPQVIKRWGYRHFIVLPILAGLGPIGLVFMGIELIGQIPIKG